MAAAAAEPAPTQAEAPKKSSKLPLILGLVLALAGGGGGFMAVQMGFIGGSADHAESPEVAVLPPIAPVAFVTLDPLIVNLPRASGREFLRFAASLEVAPEMAAEVEALKPRIVDVMNSYLRAVEPGDFEDQMIVEELRGHLLRRVQVVTGEGRVRDLLVQEFILN
jgi:flagellar FliL protein